LEWTVVNSQCFEMAAVSPGNSESLPGCSKSTAVWELRSTACKMSGDYNNNVSKEEVFGVYRLEFHDCF
jgi:hypothetical protein